MALPAAGSPWPPTALQPVYHRLTEWSAWHSGEPNRLSAFYGGVEGNDPGRTGFYASQTGGYNAHSNATVVRWFWGQRPSRTEKRAKLHIPLAGDIASTSAALLFGELPRFTTEDKAVQELLNDQLVGDDLTATLLEAADLSAGHGGVYLRICWDLDAGPYPWLSPVHAAAALPEWSYGRLKAATFWWVCSDVEGEVIRHLERHSVGAIEHGLFVGTHDDLGTQVPLALDPSTKAIPVTIEDGSLTGVIETGIKVLTTVYIPNIRPNRLWESLPIGASYGRADVQSNEGDLDALDEIWTAWLRDIRLGKGRMVVPSQYLEAQPAGQGATFDADREVYEAINSLGPTGNAGGITVAQFAIRTQEHMVAADQMTKVILRGSGYNAATFGEDQGGGATTATEIRARQGRTYGTRGLKIGYMRPRLADIVLAWLAMCNEVAGTSVVPVRPDIEWPDAVAPDPQAMANTLNLLRTARAASTETLVEMLHSDWDRPAVMAEVAKIEAESAVQNPDTFTGVGDQGDEPHDGSPAGDGPNPGA
jgi:hypothetical protein